MTAIIFYFVKWVLGGIREDEETLRIGDVAIHDEEAYPEPTSVSPPTHPATFIPTTSKENNELVTQSSSRSSSMR